MARYTTTPPGAVERKALAWLRHPRTSAQVAELLRLTPSHASHVLRRLWRKGLAERQGGARGHCYTYEVRR